MKVDTSSSRRHLYILLLIVAAVYLRALSGGFVWDDKVFFVENDILPSLRPWDLGKIAFGPVNYWGDHLPATNFLFVLEHTVFGRWTPGYHAVSILLYLAVGVAVYRLVSRLMAAHIGGSPDGPAPIFATALFLLHPVHVETVAYIVGQKDLLYGLFSVLALLSLCRAAEGGKALRPSGYLPVATFYYLSFLSKNMAVSNALFLPVFWLLFLRSGRESPLKALGIWILLNLPVLLWMLYSIDLLAPFGITQAVTPLTDRLIRGIRILGAHTMLVFKPYPLSFGYPFDQSWSLDANFWAGSAVLAALAGSLTRAPRSALSLGLVIYVIYMFPPMQIIMEVANATIYDRYLFMPLLGLCVVGGRAVSVAYDKAKVPTALISGAIIAAFCALTFMYIPTFRSDVASLRHAYRHFPGWNRAAFDYAVALIEDGRLAEAARLAENEPSFSKPDWVRDYIWGRIRLESGDTEASIRLLTRSSVLAGYGGYYPFPNVPLAEALIEKGEIQAAQRTLGEVINSPMHNPIEFYRASKMLKAIGVTVK